MIAKEKAKELVKMFSKKSNNLKQRTDWNYDKQCALIAVDEILDAIDWHEFETPNKQLEYWQEAKQ
jgi:hypothetical protein